MAETNEERCETCRFWRPDESWEVGQFVEAADCCRFPPRSGSEPGHLHNPEPKRWPVTEPYDWCDEFDRPDAACEQRLAVCLRRVIAEPDDDEPRLEYADVCERYGRKERAEFIRVQVERATLEAFEHTCGKKGEWTTTCAACGAYGHADELASQERELFKGLEPSVKDSRRDGSGWVVTVPSIDQWSRGFPERIDRIECGFWLSRGDEVRTTMPVREVEFEDTPLPGPHFQFTGTETTTGLPVYRVAERLVRLQRSDLNRGWVAIFEARWPGVAFTATSPPVNRYIGTDGDAGNPANWSLGRLPAAGDHVVIPNGATVGTLNAP